MVFFLIKELRLKFPLTEKDHFKMCGWGTLKMGFISIGTENT